MQHIGFNCGSQHDLVLPSMEELSGLPQGHSHQACYDAGDKSDDELPQGAARVTVQRSRDESSIKVAEV
jgi:hypothetical protein